MPGFRRREIAENAQIHEYSLFFRVYQGIPSGDGFAPDWLHHQPVFSTSVDFDDV
jgi:hypothetical protein